MGGREGWVDAWNAREYELRKAIPFSQVRAEWMRNHQEATRELDATPAERLDEELRGYPLLRYFAGDTYEHYREHAEQIRAWLHDLETTEA